MNEQLGLPMDVVTVHCFTCPHSVTAATPDDAHRLMEWHYASRHAALIAAIAHGLH